MSPILGIIASSVQVASGPTTIWGIESYSFSPVTSTTGTSWTSVSPTFTYINDTANGQGNSVYYLNSNRVLFGSGGFGIGGVIYTSTNATAWTAKKPNAYINSSGKYPLIYQDSKYWTIAVYAIINSTDLVTWTGATPGNEGGSFSSIAYGNGVYYVVGNQDVGQKPSYSSTNGTTWTSRNIDKYDTSLGSVDWNRVIYGDKFVAIGSWYKTTTTPVIATSTDAITWTSRTVPSDNAFGNDIAYDSTKTNKYVAAVSGDIWYSTDAVTWSSAAPGFGTDFISSANNIWIATASSHTTTFYTSTNATTWTSRTSPNNGVKGKVAWDGTYYMFALQDGNTGVTITTDFTTWTTGSGNITGSLDMWPLTYGIGYGNGTVVLAQGGGRLWNSTDMATWTSTTSGTVTYRAVTYGNSLWVTVGGSGRILTSTNATTWTSRTSNTTATLIGVGYSAESNQKYVACGQSDAIRSSTDAITWTTRTSPITGNTMNVVIPNTSGTWVIGANNGAIASSTDGITWTSRTSNATGNINAGVYGKSVWVFASSSGEVVTSTDGTTWTSRTNPFTSGDFAVAQGQVTYITDLFVITGYRANTKNTVAAEMPYITSTDGVTWTSRTLSTFPSYIPVVRMIAK